MHKKKHQLILFAIVMASVVIFFIDIQLPVGVAAGILYVLIVLAAFF